jgi:hypothetical protein
MNQSAAGEGSSALQDPHAKIKATEAIFIMVEMLFITYAPSSKVQEGNNRQETPGLSTVLLRRHCDINL